MSDRSTRANWGEQALEIAEKGFYKHKEKEHLITIENELRNCVEGTRLYKPNDFLKDNVSAILKRNQKPQTIHTKIDVWHCTTLQAITRVLEETEADTINENDFPGSKKKVVALNFASGRHPGGGFLSGAQSQEESLARSSGLFPCLVKCPEYYEANSKVKTGIYTDHVIYSPDVPIFRTDEGALMKRPSLCSFISAPAVNWGIASNRLSDRPSEKLKTLRSVMMKRVEAILTVAVDQGHENLILGAWGCGVFKCPPEEIAQIFRHLILSPNSPFLNYFNCIIFAILNPGQFEIFSDVVLNGRTVEDKHTNLQEKTPRKKE